MTEPQEIQLTLSQRIDILAARKPGMVRGYMWFFGVLAVWTAIAAAISLMAGEWLTASLTFATAACSTLLWGAAQRSLHRIPVTRAWIEDLSRFPD